MYSSYKSRLIFITCGYLILFLCFGCSKNAKEKKEGMPNILLIVSEDHGQDLGCYGNEVVYTPNIDSLASNGVQFMKAYTTYSVCSPSRASIFTGLYPHQNGQIGLATHDFRMYKNFNNIPKYLKTKGYKTGILGKLHVNPGSAIPFDIEEIAESNFAKLNLRDYASKASKIIGGGNKPFFLMVNYPDAHFPLIRQVEGLPTEVVTGENVEKTLPFVGVNTARLRELTADYYSQVNRMDECVGMLLEELKSSGKADNTLIIYLSDHGAQFSRGKGTNYEGGLKIPMVLYWPGKVVEPSIIENELVSVIDIFPTLIDATGGEMMENLPGNSLLPFAKHGKKAKGHDYIFAGGALGTAKYFFPRRSVRGKRFKLIHNLYFGEIDPYYTVYTDHVYPQVVSGTSRSEIENLPANIQEVYNRWEAPPKYELYDLEKDPWEFNNLAENPNYESDLKRLEDVLKNIRAKTRDPFLDKAIARKMREELDSINTNYPDHSYQKVDEFEWRYPKYFGEYVLDEN